MIHKVYASDKRFKSVEFHVGLNVILADKKQESNEKDSRNGLGKTTLINVMHFCLGADLNKKLLPVEDIKDWTFFIEIDLCDEKIIASRKVDNSGIIMVQGNVTKLPIKSEIDEKEQFHFYKANDWKKLLGICLFGLTSSSRTKYVPTFRNLISYFLRSGIDAYSKPFNYFRNQPPWNTQVHNAFLLGLNWDHASAAQEIKDKSKAITSLNAAIKSGIVSSQGELEAERVHLQTQIDKEKKALVEFKVHPQYQEIHDHANDLTKEIHDFSNKNLMLRRKLERYESSIKSEHVPESFAVAQLYEEAGLHFGESLKKTLTETKNFHNQVIKNRRHFLQAEVEEIKNQLSSISTKIDTDISERANLMGVLQTHGALEEFTMLQEKMIEKINQLESIKTKISDIQETSVRKKEIKATKIELETKLQRDYEQSRPEWEKAVSIFNENSQALYNESGNLIINVSDSGYSFDVEIPRSSSEGVGKMKIFCYDLMLAILFTKRGKINFLVHDSTIFDGVDSRQIAHALEHAHQESIKNGFQYICAFNSDMLPMSDFSKDFNIQNFVRLTLNDQNPKDGLMGFKFNE